MLIDHHFLPVSSPLSGTHRAEHPVGSPSLIRLWGRKWGHFVLVGNYWRRSTHRGGPAVRRRLAASLSASRTRGSAGTPRTMSMGPPAVRRSVRGAPVTPRAGPRGGSRVATRAAAH